LVDELTLVHGLWEAKDTADDLQKEISSKVSKGYPPSTSPPDSCRKFTRVEGHTFMCAIKSRAERRFHSAEGRSEALSEVEGRND